MGFFGNIFKAAVRGSKNLLKGAARGIKAAVDKVTRGLKSGYQKVKGFITGKGKGKKPWTEGDAVDLDAPSGNVRIAQGTMKYNSGRPVPKTMRVKKTGDDPFDYVKHLQVEDYGL